MSNRNWASHVRSLFRETVYNKHKFGLWQVVMRETELFKTPQQLNQLLRQMIHRFESLESPQTDEIILEAGSVQRYICLQDLFKTCKNVFKSKNEYHMSRVVKCLW